MVERVDSIVIGAGVVGLAVARALARAGREVIVVERHGHIGEETSSRNSEVIHAGIYYPTGSLKAQACVAGKHALYDFCERHGVAVNRCGKLIVAVDPGEIPVLERLKATAEANGVPDLTWLDPPQAAELEPQVRCSKALLSPSTGIVDSHAFMLALQGDAEADGAMIAFNTPVAHAAVADGGLVLETGGEQPMTVAADLVVNAAGLSAVAFAAGIDGFPADRLPEPRFAKGNYFAVSGKPPFRRLVYPVPEPGGLGVHATIDLGGQVRFGPDVEWVSGVHDRIYDVDPHRADAFYGAIRRYWPDLADGALSPDYSGLRPKLVGPGEPAADFVIQGPIDHGVLGLVNLLGIESPGLTASLALADRVVAALAEGNR